MKNCPQVGVGYRLAWALMRLCIIHMEVIGASSLKLTLIIFERAENVFNIRFFYCRLDFLSVWSDVVLTYKSSVNQFLPVDNNFPPLIIKQRERKSINCMKLQQIKSIFWGLKSQLIKTECSTSTSFFSFSPPQFHILKQICKKLSLYFFPQAILRKSCNLKDVCSVFQFSL